MWEGLLPTSSKPPHEVHRFTLFTRFTLPDGVQPLTSRFTTPFTTRCGGFNSFSGERMAFSVQSPHLVAFRCKSCTRTRQEPPAAPRKAAVPPDHVPRAPSGNRRPASKAARAYATGNAAGHGGLTTTKCELRPATPGPNEEIPCRPWPELCAGAWLTPLAGRLSRRARAHAPLGRPGAVRPRSR